MLSAVLHLVLVGIAALVLSPNPRTVAVDERAVAIALAPAPTQIPSFVADEAATGASGAAPSSAASSAPLEAALPSLSEAPRAVSLASALPSHEENASPSNDALLGAASVASRGRPRILPGLGDEQILAEERERQRRLAAESGPLGKVSLFGSAPAWGRSFVFLIDRSKSMGGEGLGALQAASKELLTGLSGLSADQRFQVIGYNQSPHYFTRRALEPANSENVRRAASFVGNLPAYGRTEHYAALMSALALRPDVIFLLTDGGDPQLSEAQITSFTRVNGGAAAVHCLHFGAGDASYGEDSLRRLAEANGGEYRYIAMP